MFHPAAAKVAVRSTWTMSWASLTLTSVSVVKATALPPSMAPRKLNRAEYITPARGVIAWQAIIVATVALASWKPLVKAKKSVTATTAATRTTVSIN